MTLAVLMNFELLETQRALPSATSIVATEEEREAMVPLQ